MSDASQAEGRRSRTFERLDALLWALVGAAIIWGASSITALSEQAAAQNQQILYLTEMVSDLRAELRARSADRYTASDAIRDLAPIRRDLADHEERLRVLEGIDRGRSGP